MFTFVVFTILLFWVAVGTAIASMYNIIPMAVSIIVSIVFLVCVIFISYRILKDLGDSDNHDK